MHVNEALELYCIHRFTVSSQMPKTNNSSVLLCRQSEAYVSAVKCLAFRAIAFHAFLNIIKVREGLRLLNIH